MSATQNCPALNVTSAGVGSPGVGQQVFTERLLCVGWGLLLIHALSNPCGEGVTLRSVLQVGNLSPERAQGHTTDKWLN